MQAPNWTDFLQCSVCTSKFDQLDVLPISLTCGHTLCTRCLGKLKTQTCPYDKVTIRVDIDTFPANAAILQLLGHKVDTSLGNVQVEKLAETDKNHYYSAVSAILELSLFLQPLAEHGITAAITYLTKPMLKKLVTVLNCQILESDGQVRAMRAARSIADRTVTELLVMHQNQQQISTLLWTAVRNRGCQFLGPVMQEEALRLILRVSVLTCAPAPCDLLLCAAGTGVWELTL
jgi:RING finger/CCCH-type zinc finger protein